MRNAHCGMRNHHGRSAAMAHCPLRTAHGEAGQIALEYVFLLAAVVLPLVGVVYMLWEILMAFYWNTALVVSMPYL